MREGGGEREREREREHEENGTTAVQYCVQYEGTCKLIKPKVQCVHT